MSGFADPVNSRDPYNSVVSIGDDSVSMGGRNAPSAAYAGYSPILHQAMAILPPSRISFDLKTHEISADGTHLRFLKI